MVSKREVSKLYEERKGNEDRNNYYIKKKEKTRER
jgi:hypothetical protein